MYGTKFKIFVGKNCRPDGLIAALLHDGGCDPLVGPGYPLPGDDSPQTVEETLHEKKKPCMKSTPSFKTMHFCLKKTELK